MKTSYFAKLVKLTPNQIPISICGKAPAFYSGLQYKKLAPKYGFFMDWKDNHDNQAYTRCFNSQVLGVTTPEATRQELFALAGIEDESEKEIVLICYEKPEDFCHRHIVATWMSTPDNPVEELIL